MGTWSYFAPVVLGYLNSMDKIGKINFTVEMTSNIDLEFPNLKFNHLDTEAFANLI